jgi:long-chain acyl-CoA synthetase
VHGVEVKIGDNDELLARGQNIMMGYWKDEAATEQVLDRDGWLHSGDQAKIDADGFISIIGRIKEILVLANGEKVPPADMEHAIADDELFEQSLVIGEQMPYLTALVVLNRELWGKEAKRLNINYHDRSELRSEKVEQLLLDRIRQRINEFPGYVRIRRATATLSPWTVENGLMTPTLKLKRAIILERYKDDIARMYKGHALYK